MTECLTRFAEIGGNLFEERTSMYNLFINTGKELGHINPEIQGHFSEHL